MKHAINLLLVFAICIVSAFGQNKKLEKLANGKLWFVPHVGNSIYFFSDSIATNKQECAKYRQVGDKVIIYWKDSKEVLYLRLLDGIQWELRSVANDRTKGIIYIAGFEP